MCNETVAVNIIRRARKNHQSDHFSAKEIDFLINHKELTHFDKCLWLKIACLTHNDPNLTCTIELRTITNEPLLEVVKSLCHLKRWGFLLIGWDLDLDQYADFRVLLQNLDYQKSLDELPVLELLNLRQINSAHCTLVVPNRGLMAILDGVRGH